ncbi:MAG TPA: S41 family peptidase [Gemmataceae bacterium]|nr:S41 family peptidase [Gemmataceae bacterium]
MPFTLRFWRLPMVALLCAACLQGVFPATAHADEFKDKAAAAEKRRDWLEACRWYDKELRKDRNQPDVRDAYQRCLRRLYLVRRGEDHVYREAVAKLKPEQALDVYLQVLAAVRAAYVDSSRTDLNSLLQQGVQELQFDFEEDVFVQEYFAGAKPAQIDKFKKALADWRTHTVKDEKDVRAEVLEMDATARRCGLDVKPALQVAIRLELSAGACNALDEYTLFLTPGYYTDVQAMAQGKFVSIGVDLGSTADGQVEVLRVYPKSPAEDARLMPGDRILAVNHQGDLTPDQAADKLRGEAGSMVEIVVQSPMTMPGQPILPRTVKLMRQPVFVPSVMEPLVYNVTTEMGAVLSVGYIQINHFQDSTVQDVKEALARLQTAGVQALILDLRGNPGGSFKAGLQVAELFLDEGVIVYSESPLADYNRPYKVESRNPVTLPIVVLVDRDTASAAEVVAGALQEHRSINTRIVGQTTFGKGSIQGVIPLDKKPLENMPGGIRITIAKLFSPGKHQPYTDRGVTPDILVNQEGAAVRDAGLDAVVQLLRNGAMNGMKMN